jgi:tRNA (adenine22-N1)-methyltransferase
MRPISERLSLIASFIPEGDNVCDVGTDHGYLAAFLSLSGKYGKITATDIGKLPLENARTNLERLGIEGVDLVLCDGLCGVARDRADTVIIAGMGGDVISGILSRSEFIKDKDVTLILQPMTAADTLRQYLADNGFEVINEVALEENRKIYSIMVCKYSGVPYFLDDTRLRIGILRPKTEANKKYILKQAKICEKCAKDLEKHDASRAEIFLDTAQKLQALTEE